MLAPGANSLNRQRLAVWTPYTEDKLDRRQTASQDALYRLYSGAVLYPGKMGKATARYHNDGQAPDSKKDRERSS